MSLRKAGQSFQRIFEHGGYDTLLVLLDQLQNGQVEPIVKAAMIDCIVSTEQTTVNMDVGVLTHVTGNCLPATKIWDHLKILWTLVLVDRTVPSLHL